MTAGDLTKQLLLALPRHFPGARFVRLNVGGAVPMQNVRRAIQCLQTGSTVDAIKMLNRPTKFGVPGLPDIAGFIPVKCQTTDGREIKLAVLTGIEVKVGKDRQSDDQRICQRVFETAGAIYVVATDKGYDPVADCVAAVRGLLL